MGLIPNFFIAPPTRSGPAGTESCGAGPGEGGPPPEQPLRILEVGAGVGSMPCQEMVQVERLAIACLFRALAIRENRPATCLHQTAPDAAHVDCDNLQPRGSEALPEMIKIAGAAPPIREQNERVS
jgi:hypothetical protein